MSVIYGGKVECSRVLSNEKWRNMMTLDWQFFPRLGFYMGSPSELDENFCLKCLGDSVKFLVHTCSHVYLHAHLVRFIANYSFALPLLLPRNQKGIHPN